MLLVVTQDDAHASLARGRVGSGGDTARAGMAVVTVVAAVYAITV